ncbi:acyl-coenzyme A thioesterase 9, mitochondrial-like isoform X2 [Harmonia axyridis]|uniref:acyl-coenzyme A thioesterase 9, mitochondrial-like isoform X2 n=1 Tax=Harmonia axyridis TaxID=115357 RepID=UPI001E2775F0|nr:acyl-coenzyme A thioesterase 9, mitochondrial-like isoform X2 [Harmonia axyridis]
MNYFMNPIKSYKNFNFCTIFCENVKHFSSGKKLPTVNELTKQRSKLLGLSGHYEPTPSDRSHLLKYLPKFEDLPPRSIKDSFLEGLIPLSTDENLQEKYITFLGRVRIGRLLEDMDIFAVPKDVSSPFILVTAHVDRIGYTAYQRRHNEDIKISGFVSWVGKSSMEVVVKLEQFFEGSWHKITRALFLMVARNATGTGSVSINPLKASNDMEKKIIEGGEERKLRRSQASTKHISQMVPSAEEQKLVHDLYKNIRKLRNNNKSAELSKNFVPMHKCKLSNTIFCQPEDRNFYNTVFGGFIMRHATELTWILGFQFFRHRPAIKHISDISFRKPIAVNALMQMFAKVVYTKDDYAQIIVNVFASDPMEGKRDKTNTFHFTLKSSKTVDQIYPMSYHEAMLYIDGMRHFNTSMNQNVDEVADAMDEYMLKLSKS